MKDSTIITLREIGADRIITPSDVTHGYVFYTCIYRKREREMFTYGYALYIYVYLYIYIYIYIGRERDRER